MRTIAGVSRLLIVVAMAVPGTGHALEFQRVQQADSGVTFDFQAADIRVVISALAEVAGITIIYGDLPNRSVTLRTGRPVPISEVRQLLETIVRANGLELFDENGLLRIAAVVEPEPPTPTVSPVQATGQDRSSGTRRLYVHQLSHARADRIVQTLGALFGSSRGFATSGSAFGGSLSQALREQREAPYRNPDLQAGLPEPRSDQAGGLAMGLQQPVDMVPDPLTNTVLVLATPADYQVIAGAIQQLDIRPLQVMIEVLIAEVRHNQASDLGIEVNIPLREGDEDGVTFNLQGFSAGNVAMQILGIGNVNADVVVRALATRADVTILSRPIILAQNNQEARILVGDQRPFIQVSRSLPTDGGVRDQVVQYRNVGTQLSILPTVTADGYVNLSITQEVSTATAEIQFGAPVINTREIETELLVRDGQTIVLGGLVDHQKETTNTGIPLLKDIPLIGAIFGSRSTRTVASELLLLLTPHIIRNDEEMEETTQQLREATGMLNKQLPERLPLLDSRRSRADTLVAPARRDTLQVLPDTLIR